MAKDDSSSEHLALQTVMNSAGHRAEPFLAKLITPTQPDPREGGEIFRELFFYRLARRLLYRMELPDHDAHFYFRPSCSANPQPWLVGKHYRSDAYGCWFARRPPAQAYCLDIQLMAI
jgi:hypothetical protein